MSIRFSFVSVCFALTLSVSLFGCGNNRAGGAATPMADAGTGADTSPMADAAADALVDTSPEDTGPVSCTMGIPRTAIGGAVGDSFPGFELQDCDGEIVDFYGDGFCDAPVTVVSFAAGWCAPCITESADLTEYITEPYRDRNVRVIQVLIEKEDSTPPDLAYCASWVERFGLTNIEVIDPTDRLIAMLAGPGGAVGLPLTVIVGRDGVIKAREEGSAPGLASLRSAIDHALGMPTTTVGLGETCGGMFVCGPSAICSPDSMVCVVSPEVAAACEGATPITLAAGTSTQMVTVETGRGVLTATCGDTIGKEKLFDLTIPEGSYDLVVTTDTPTNQAVTGLDTIIYLRNMCLETEGELCNDDITPPTAEMPDGNLFSTLTVTSVPAGVLTLGVELYRGAEAPSPVEVSFELRAR